MESEPTAVDYQNCTGINQRLILQVIEHLHSDTVCIRMWVLNQALIFFFDDYTRFFLRSLHSLRRERAAVSNSYGAHDEF